MDRRGKSIDLGSRSVKKIEIESVKKFPLSEHGWDFEPKKNRLNPCEFGNFRSQSQFLADDSSLEFCILFFKKKYIKKQYFSIKTGIFYTP
jgi:hypothetical protein